MLRSEMGEAADSADGLGSAANETPLDPPRGGFPWQLGLCDVFHVLKRPGGQLTYKVKCQLCAWGPTKPTTLARVKDHYGAFPESRRL